MAHKYEHDADIQNIVSAILRAGSAEEVERRFADLQHVDDDARAYVVDTVESLAVMDWNATAPVDAELEEISHFFEVMEANRNNSRGKSMIADFIRSVGSDPSEAQTTAQIFLNIIWEKNDRAHLLVRTYMEEAAKMSDEDYNSVFEHAKLMVDVQSRMMLLAPTASKPDLKPNPFRAKPPGGM